MAITCGLILASILLLAADKSPIEAISSIFRDAFTCSSFDRCNIFTTFALATPLMLTGLSAVVAFRSGIFSIGQEGQMMLGAIVAAYIGHWVPLPDNIHSIVISIGAIIVGGLYGWFAGWLKIRLGINEIISTIILSEIAILLLLYLVNFPMRGDRGATAYSPKIDETAMLKVFAPGSKFGTGFVIAVFAVILVYFYLWKSGKGYEQRMSGEAPRFAFFGGIKSEKAALRGMFISGGLAGLAGAIEVMGVHYRINQGFNLMNLGFDGLSVAILGLVHPLGVFIVGIFLAGIRMGAQLGLQFTLGIPRELGGTIIGFMILFVAAEKLFQKIFDIDLRSKFRRKKDA
jgi:general nucleoside transport system permease protein